MLSLHNLQIRISHQARRLQRPLKCVFSHRLHAKLNLLHTLHKFYTTLNKYYKNVTLDTTRDPMKRKSVKL